MILTVCQPVEGYFMTSGSGIASIVHSYLHSYSCFVRVFLYSVLWYQVFLSNTNNLHTVVRSIDKIKENCFKLTKERSRRYPAQTITDADYADDIVLLANAPAQAETLLHSLERGAAGISFHVNAHKTKYMCFNQTSDISTQNGSALKPVDKFTDLGSSVSSTETDIDTRLAKASIAIDRVSVVWKSDLTDKMKRSCFQAAIVLILLSGCAWTLTKRIEKKLDGSYTRT